MVAGRLHSRPLCPALPLTLLLTLDHSRGGVRSLFQLGEPGVYSGDAPRHPPLDDNLLVVDATRVPMSDVHA